MSNAIIFLGNTGVGKSFICNKIFELCSTPITFKSSSNTVSVTQSVQQDIINYKNKSYTIIDSPGFFDTAGPSHDGINICRIVQALEKCEDIFAIVFVFTDRFSTPHKMWFDRISDLVTKKNRGNIILLHNKQNDYNPNEYMRNSYEINEKLGGTQEYIWLVSRPDQTHISEMLDKLISNTPFRLTNFIIPEVCYEKTERGPPFEEVVSSNTKDEGQMVDQVKDTSHFEQRTEWNRGKGNIFGEMGLRGMPGAKRTVDVWVPSQTVEKVWVQKMVTRNTIKKYQNVFKIRFDGSRDLSNKEEIGSREEVL